MEDTIQYNGETYTLSQTNDCAPFEYNWQSVCDKEPSIECIYINGNVKLIKFFSYSSNTSSGVDEIGQLIV